MQVIIASVAREWELNTTGMCGSIPLEWGKWTSLKDAGAGAGTGTGTGTGTETETETRGL